MLHNKVVSTQIKRIYIIKVNDIDKHGFVSHLFGFNRKTTNLLWPTLHQKKDCETQIELDRNRFMDRGNILGSVHICTWWCNTIYHKNLCSSFLMNRKKIEKKMNH